LYLSPKDYHRIHAPCDLVVRGYSYFPGSLFSVNPSTERAFPEVFARNERVAFHCESSKGPFVLVMVGALIVGSIEAAWEGVLAPNAAGRKLVVRNYQGGEIRLAKGEELGRFHLGSTVILLFPQKTGRLTPLASGAPMRLGQRIGQLLV
ncbi:MAG: archaetidylserine decarboxylase, partial [Bdellovibrionota bacterium]